MRDKLKLIIPLTFLIIFILFFCVSCRYSHCSNISSETTQANFTYLHKIAKPGTFKMSYKNFDGTENIGLNVRRGNRIKFKYKSTTKNGALSITITDPYGTVIETIPINRKGSLYVKAKDAGRISIQVTGKNTSGSFKISWKKELL